MTRTYHRQSLNRHHWVRKFHRHEDTYALEYFVILTGLIANSMIESNLGSLRKTLRVFLSIFDQTLTAHFFSKQVKIRINRFFSLEHLTSKVYDDSISDVIVPSSGSSELIKSKLQTLSTFATLIRFWWQYHHSIAN